MNLNGISDYLNLLYYGAYAAIAVLIISIICAILIIITLVKVRQIDKRLQATFARIVYERKRHDT